MKKFPTPQKLFNLREYRKVDDKEVCMRTIVYNVPYAMCKALGDRCRLAPHFPGTYWKIEENKSNNQNERTGITPSAEVAG